MISEGDYIVDVQEKPNFKLEILSGVYILKPAIFGLIPKNTYFGIDSLILVMLKKKLKVAKYVNSDYWLDIGRVKDLRAARHAFNRHFKKLRKWPKMR